MNQLSTTLPRLCGVHDRIVAAAGAASAGIARLRTTEATRRQRGWACPDRVIQLDDESFRVGRCASEAAKPIRRRRRRPA